MIKILTIIITIWKYSGRVLMIHRYLASVKMVDMKDHEAKGNEMIPQR